jgi:prepilin-type N-terminal cleavage/methylation domain-containing protein
VMKSTGRTQRRRAGFTMVEITLVIAILGLLSVLAIPSLVKARDRSRKGAVVNEMRATAEAFQMFAQEKNRFPASSGGFGSVPTGMALYLPRKSTWTSSPKLGGYWWWINVSPGTVWGYSGVVCYYNPYVDREDLLEIDQMADDGQEESGVMRVSWPWIFYGVQ